MNDDPINVDKNFISKLLESITIFSLFVIICVYVWLKFKYYVGKLKNIYDEKNNNVENDIINKIYNEMGFMKIFKNSLKAPFTNNFDYLEGFIEERKGINEPIKLTSPHHNQMNQFQPK